VPGDGLRTGVQAVTGEGFAEPHDPVLHLRIDHVRTAVRPPRAGPVGHLPFSLEAFDQGLHPKPRQPVLTGHLALGTSFHGDSGDHQPGHRHTPTPKIKRGVNYVPRQLPTMSCNQSPLAPPLVRAHLPLLSCCTFRPVQQKVQQR
jgi:hypothetical protein